MSFLYLLAIAFGLAMDAFSVAIASSFALGTLTYAQWFRMSLSFGLFQFLMPIVGWAVGSAVADRIAAYDHWVAFALLAYVGSKMIWESFADEEREKRGDPTRGTTLIVLSVATSIDALAVGLGLALLQVPVLFPALVIGVVAAGMTLLGMRIGHLAGGLLGPWMERLGGLVLWAIGINVLFEHLLG
ncbi:MAG: manganese efflux pump MntP family protein [Dehalococcoidales bacterium]|nr:manganese efflux pump MntP family protein [Dehalococcoidales bacterium]